MHTELLLKLFGTLHIQYRYNEHVHVEVSCQKIFWAKWLLIRQLFCMAFVFSIVPFFYWPLLYGGYLIRIAYFSFHFGWAHSHFGLWDYARTCHLHIVCRIYTSLHWQNILIGQSFIKLFPFSYILIIKTKHRNNIKISFISFSLN